LFHSGLLCLFRWNYKVYLDRCGDYFNPTFASCTASRIAYNTQEGQASVKGLFWLCTVPVNCVDICSLFSGTVWHTCGSNNSNFDNTFSCSCCLISGFLEICELYADIVQDIKHVSYVYSRHFSNGLMLGEIHS
jgi:hypothetical protein